jgi:hypothetical protein
MLAQIYTITFAAPVRVADVAEVDRSFSETFTPDGYRGHYALVSPDRCVVSVVALWETMENIQPRWLQQGEQNVRTLAALADQEPEVTIGLFEVMSHP